MGVTVAATKRSSALIFPVTAILIAPATRLPPLTWMRMILNRSVDGSGGGLPAGAPGGVGVGAPSFESVVLLSGGEGGGGRIPGGGSGRLHRFFVPAPGFLAAPTIFAVC